MDKTVIDIDADTTEVESNQNTSSEDNVVEKEQVDATLVDENEAKAIEELEKEQTQKHNFEHINDDEYDLVFKYIWDDEQYYNFEKVYLFDANEQLQKSKKGMVVSTLISGLLLISCAFMLIMSLVSQQSDSIVLYIVGVIVGIVGILFSLNYQKVLLNRITGQIKMFMLANDFVLKFKDNIIVTQGEQVDISKYESMVLFKDIVFLTSGKLNNFLMMNAKNNENKDKLINLLKSKPNLTFYEEEQPFSLSKYGIQAQAPVKEQK